MQLVHSTFGEEDIFAKYLGKVEKKDEYVISYLEKFLLKQSKLIVKALPSLVRVQEGVSIVKNRSII